MELNNPHNYRRHVHPKRSKRTVSGYGRLPPSSYASLERFYSFGLRIIYTFLPFHERILFANVSKACQKHVHSGLAQTKSLDLKNAGVLKYALKIELPRLAQLRVSLGESNIVTEEFKQFISKHNQIPKLTLACHQDYIDVVSASSMKLVELSCEFGIFLTLPLITKHFQTLRSLDISTPQHFKVTDTYLVPIEWPSGLERLAANSIYITGTQFMQKLFEQTKLTELCGITFENKNSCPPVIQYMQRLKTLKMIVNINGCTPELFRKPQGGIEPVCYLKDLRNLSLKLMGTPNQREKSSDGISFHCPSLEVFELCSTLGWWCLGDVLGGCKRLKELMIPQLTSRNIEVGDFLSQSYVAPQIERIEIRLKDYPSDVENVVYEKFVKMVPNVKHVTLTGLLNHKDLEKLNSKYWQPESLAIHTGSQRWSPKTFSVLKSIGTSFCPTLKRLELPAHCNNIWMSRTDCEVSFGTDVRGCFSM